MLSEWLRRWARLYSLQNSRREDLRQLTPEDFALYAEALSNLTIEQLDTACQLATRYCKFFPTPADVLAQVHRADRGGAALVAEQAWHDLLNWVRAYVVPDIGIDCEAPRLDPATEHAARAAGSFYFLERCSEDELIWAKKRFMEDYTTVQETAKVAPLLTSTEARLALTKAVTTMSQPALPASARYESVATAKGGNKRLATAKEILASVAAADPPARHGTPPARVTFRDDRTPQEKDPENQKRRLAEWMSKRKQS